MALHVDNDLDYLYLGDSDVEKAESSEDEIDILLNGTPEQRRRLRRNSKTRAKTQGKQKKRQQSDSDSEDDFEKTLNAELDERVSALERSRHGGSAGQQASAPQGKKAAEAYYDDIYFDSDEEQENQEQKQKRKVISNDDLLYDPDMDDEDERWVQHQINSHQMRQASRLAGATKTRGKKGPPVSDAKLDCPACMTTLCLDCQRHEVYKHQYRAMFVMNCTVDTTQTLHYPVPEEKKKKKKKEKRKRQQTEQQAMEVEGEAMQAEQGEAIPEPGTSGGQEDLYNPVKCQECGTVVGVYDSDEVYHFFNILASYS